MGLWVDRIDSGVHSEARVKVSHPLRHAFPKGTLLLPPTLCWPEKVLRPKSTSVEETDSLCMVRVRVWEEEISAK